MLHISIMMTIDNLAQAKESVEALSDFLKRFEQTLGALGSLTGQTSTALVAPHRTAPPSPIPAPSRISARPMPDAMPERIDVILRAAGRPMTVSEMINYHGQLGWVVADRKALYRQILASAYYSAKKKKVLTNDNGKYSIAAQEPAAPA